MKILPPLFASLLALSGSSAFSAEAFGLWECESDNGIWAVKQELPSGAETGKAYFHVVSAGNIDFGVEADAADLSGRGNVAYAGVNPMSKDWMNLRITDRQTERDAGYRRENARGTLDLGLAHPVGAEPGDSDFNDGPRLPQPVSVSCSRDLEL